MRTFVIELRKEKRTGVIPLMIAIGVLGAAYAFVNFIVRKDTLLNLPLAPMDVLLTQLYGMIMVLKKFQKLSIVALIISIFPLMTFIPVLFHITLTDGVRSVWAGINIVSVFTGLILSITCIKNSDSRSAINIISTIISSFWVLLMGGIIALALFISIVQ